MTRGVCRLTCCGSPLPPRLLGTVGVVSAKVVVAGMSHVWRRGMAGLLEDSAFEVVVSEALSTWTPHKDGSCIVLGVDAPDDVGLLRPFREDHPYTPVVVVVSELDISTFARLIRSGATAVVAEHEPAEVIHRVISEALAGRVSIEGDLAQSLAGLVPDVGAIARWVTDREVDWLRAMAAGITVLELAEDVGYSERAMFRQLKEMYRRIGAKNRTEALLWASRRGLLAEESADRSV